jgi:hypothetical protein
MIDPDPMYYLSEAMAEYVDDCDPQISRSEFYEWFLRVKRMESLIHYVSRNFNTDDHVCDEVDAIFTE